MDNKVKPFERLGNLVKEAIEEKKQANSEFTQLSLADECNLNPADISRMISGEKCPAALYMPALARVLDLELSELLILRAMGESSKIPANASTTDLAPISKVFENLLEHYRATNGKKSSENLMNEGIDLRRWPWPITNIIPGDRREKPPQTTADIMALSASTADFSFLPSLSLEKSTRIRSDKILHVASEETLENLLGGHLLVLGSPACNLFARRLNETACFPFVIRQKERETERDFYGELDPIRYEPDKLEAFADENKKENKEKLRTLRHMVQNFATPGFIDAIKYEGIRGQAPKISRDYGVVTLCRHPWARDKVAILAAGRSGPGTAAAVKLLGRPDAFKIRPLGGVFRVAISQQAPWERRYDYLDPQFDTHPYDIEEFKRSLEDRKVKAKLGSDRVADLIEFVDTLQYISAIESD